MLNNELCDLEKRILQLDRHSSEPLLDFAIELELNRTFRAWEKAIFSDTPEQTLLRYFRYHQEGIQRISDTLFNISSGDWTSNIQEEILVGVDKLRMQYAMFFDEDFTAPFAYHQNLIKQSRKSNSTLCDKINDANISLDLKKMLLAWLYEITSFDKSKRYSFRALSYFQYIIDQLELIDFHSKTAEDEVEFFLYRANFNNLCFLVCRQNVILQKVKHFLSIDDMICYLRKQKADIAACPEIKGMAYDTSWPSIKYMLTLWLAEEISLLEQSLANANAMKPTIYVEKLPLEMSVSHMACLIRLFYEESVFASQNLQFIFKSFASYFQSKRQSAISPGSLSKEYYSIDQHTAARVRDLLQRMVARINRNFFPIGFVANATILSYLSMR